MRILLFIFLVTNMFAANPTSLIKGSVYAAEATGDITYLFEGEVNSKLLDKGDEIRIKELVEFKTLRDNCRLHLYFSNKSNIILHKKGWFTVENFEHFIDKDENGNVVGGAEIVNMYVRGKVDFIQDSVKEEGYVSVNTAHADLEIKSKSFYVHSNEFNTVVECYDGKILMTDSIDLKQTVLEAGQCAEIFSSGGAKNTSIKVHPLTPEQAKSREERISKSPPVVWKFSSRPVGTKP
jgi:hypothetical protein